MKYILLLLFVAFCYAVPTTPSVSFGEDGTITITGADGKKVVISKAVGTTGQRNVEITVPDLSGTARTIKVNQDYNSKSVDVDGVRYKRSPVAKTAKETKKPKTQMEILDEIFTDYQGAVDMKSFEKVLKEIDGYVKTGELDSTIYDVLKGFAQYEVLNPEETYSGPSYSRLAHLQSYLNKIFGGPVSSNAFGAKQPAFQQYQGINPSWYTGAQWPIYGPNVENGNFYGPMQGQQASPVQETQQYPQPSPGPYQQQMPLPQQQLPVPQQQWDIPQQLAQQQQKVMWDQQSTVPQQWAQTQKLPSQQMLAPPQDPANWALHQGQMAQQLPWNQVQKQQFLGPQQYYPQQTPLTQENQMSSPNYQPQQQFDTTVGQMPQTQQGYYWNPFYFRNPFENQIQQQPWSQSQVSPMPQNLAYQQNPGPFWPLFKQQFLQKQQPLMPGQSYTPTGFSWQKFWAPMSLQRQYPVV